ncbi:MAG: VOC family protein [Nocardioidaceae bacterium]
MSELTPYLCVRDARAAIEWYVDRLGAEVTVEPIVMPDDRVGHVELAVDGARWMMSDEHPEIQVEAPVPGRGAAVTLHLTVYDVDGLTKRMVDGGAVLDRGPEDNPPVGRVAVLRDPFGHRWFLNQAD